MFYPKPASASSTSVGAGGRSPRAMPSRSTAGSGGGTVKQRKSGASSAASGGRSRAAAANSGGMWRFYTDDSPGIKVYVFVHSFILL